MKIRPLDLASSLSIALHLLGLLLILLNQSSQPKLQAGYAAPIINAFLAPAITLSSVPNSSAPNPTANNPKSVTITDSTIHTKQLVTDAKLLKQALPTEQAKELGELRKQQQKLKKDIAARTSQDLMMQTLRAEQTAIKTSLKHHLSNQGLANELQRQLLQINLAISSRWSKPTKLGPQDFVKILIELAPGGELLEQRIMASSGNATLEKSARLAVKQAAPFSLSSDPKIFDEIRQLVIVFRDRGIAYK